MPFFFQPKSFKAETVIQRQDDSSTELFIVTLGSVKLYRAPLSDAQHVAAKPSSLVGLAEDSAEQNLVALFVNACDAAPRSHVRRRILQLCL